MSDEIKKYMSIMESFYMSSPYTQNSQSEDKENITYSKTKKKGDSSVTVSANADSMDELHDILKLAGITLPKSDSHDHEHDHEHDHDEEPKQGEYADMCDGCGKPGDECECEDCDAHGDEEGEKKPVVISLKPKDAKVKDLSIKGYNPVSGDKKEILNALMNRYRSL
tara:strand:- start:88 stop:588 length:501 start_codon:yes stop_codon:yes gene_type:complete